MMHKLPFKIFLLIGFVLTGILLHHLGVFDWYRFIDVSESWADRWWFPLVVIFAKIVLYTFALPGSALYCVAGILYPPIEATLIIVIGGVVGAVFAFIFSQRISSEATRKIKTSRSFAFMQRHSDFATLCAIRLLPTFPHSVLNYGSGMVHVPYYRFVLSTLIGFSVKGYLYASTIRSAARANEIEEIVSLGTMLPLILLSLLFILAKILRKKFLR